MCKINLQKVKNIQNGVYNDGQDGGSNFGWL